MPSPAARSTPPSSGARSPATSRRPSPCRSPRARSPATGRSLPIVFDIAIGVRTRATRSCATSSTSARPQPAGRRRASWPSTACRCLPPGEGRRTRCDPSRRPCRAGAGRRPAGLQARGARTAVPSRCRARRGRRSCVSDAPRRRRVHSRRLPTRSTRRTPTHVSEGKRLFSAYQLRRLPRATAAAGWARR